MQYIYIIIYMSSVPSRPSRPHIAFLLSSSSGHTGPSVQKRVVQWPTTCSKTVKTLIVFRQMYIALGQESSMCSTGGSPEGSGTSNGGASACDDVHCMMAVLKCSCQVLDCANQCKTLGDSKKNLYIYIYISKPCIAKPCKTICRGLTASNKFRQHLIYYITTYTKHIYIYKYLCIDCIY